MNPEIGRELKFEDLESRKRTGVVVGKVGDDRAVTMWLIDFDKDMVRLYAGEIKMTLLLFVSLNGTFHDDTGVEVKLFEWLGTDDERVP